MVPPTETPKPADAATTPTADANPAGKQKVRPMIRMLGMDVPAAEEVSQLIPLSQVAPELFAPPAAKKKSSTLAITAGLAILFGAAGGFAGYTAKQLDAERVRTEQLSTALSAAQTQLAEAQGRMTHAETRVRVLEGERETMVQDAAAKAARIQELETKLAKASKKRRR